VAEFLKKEGFEVYVPNFHKARITPSTVTMLNDSHLKEMGIAKVAHRIRILNVTRGFTRALTNHEKNASILDLQNWYWRPVCYPRTFKVTLSSIVVNDPQPWVCSYRQEYIGVTQITDIVGPDYLFISNI